MRKGIIILSVVVMIASLPFVTAGYRTDFHPIENERSIADKKICIDGNIKCSTKPFFYGQDENFFVTLNNTGDDEIAAMVEFHLWDPIEKEWEFFGEARDTISPMSREDTNPWDVSLSWSFKMLDIEWIRAELYVDDELVGIKENRFFMGFFIF